MGQTLIKMKIMPSSPDEDLEEIKKEIELIVKQSEGKVTKFEEEPIAFGLKAIIGFFEIPEDKETETIENNISKIETVNSAVIIDMRRAFG